MGRVKDICIPFAAGRVPTFLLLTTLAIVLFSAGSAQAFQTHSFTNSFTPAGGFGFPLGVAINQSSEEVYVSDYSNGTVYAFQASGAPDPTHPRLIEAPPETEPFPLANPYGVAVDNSAGATHGDIYVAQAGGGAVDQFSPAGVRSAQPAITAANIPAEGSPQSGGLPNVANNGGFTPTGVAVTSTGDIYVADQSNNVVDLFEPNGTFISQLAGGDISGPNLIAVDGSDHLYVAQNGSGLLEFSPTGTCLNSCTPIDPAANLGVAISPTGQILADEGGQVSEFESDAALIDRFGQPSAEPPFGGLSSSFDLAINDTSGAIYATNLGAGSVSVFGPLLTLPDTTTGPPANPAQTAVTLTGHVDPDSAHGGAPISECRFEYGTDSSYGLGSLPCEPATPLGGPTDVSAQLSGLSSETTYHYRLYAKSAMGAAVGADESFTPHSVAGLETQAASNIGPNFAQLNGSFIGNGEDTHYYFEYGTDTSYGQSTAPKDAGSPSGPAATPASIELSAITTLATYHYRIVAENSAGITRGQDQEFTTLQAVAGITSQAPTEVKATTARLNGSFIGNGEDTHYFFEYGTDQSYGHLTPEADAHSPGGPNPTQISSEISGLSPFTTYHYRVAASNGGGTNYGGDQEFTTLAGPPNISAESVSRVHSLSALLLGQVNPENGDTTYHFEYGPEDCAISSCTVTASVDIGAEPTPIGVSAQLGDLTAATTYHWRIVAESVGGTTVGPDRSFTTYSFVPVLKDPCPNALARQQTGAAELLDCRAYELVSTGDSGGYSVESDLVPGQTPYPSYPQAENPSRVLYAVHGGGIPGTNHPTDRGPDPYIASRGEDGWSTEYVGVPANDPFAAGPFSSVSTGADQSLQTLAFGGPDGCSPCFAGGYTGIPLRLPNGELSQGMSGPENPGPAATPDGYIAKQLSANGEHFIFGSTARFAPGGNDQSGDLSIYDHNLRTGATEVVSNLPGSEDFPTPLPCPQGKGACHSPADPNGIAELDISADGSHILLGQKVATDAAGNVYWHLYMDINDSINTIDLTPGATAGALFDGMSADGSKVFFTSREALAADDHDTSADIYEASITASTATLTRISTGTGGAGDSDACDPASNSNAEHWNTVGALKDCGALAIGGGGGVAANGDTIYFLSPELLDGAANGVQNAPNLYIARLGSTPRFVATLDPEDPVVLDSRRAVEQTNTADFELTPDGRFAAFGTTRALSDYENAGFSEVYRYEPASETLSCLSCNPTGVEPVGNASLASRGLSLTDDGRVFFTTSDALVLRDVDNRKDVYEWEADGTDTCDSSNPNFFQAAAGCVGLVSAGSSPADSSLLGASSDSKDVYFFTRDGLAAQDHDGPVMKIYDARAGGGFFEVPKPPPCAASDECHGAGSQAPSPPEIRTTTGNPKSGSTTKCKKHFVGKHGKCVNKPHKTGRDHHTAHSHG